MVYGMRDIFGSNTQQITINIDIKYIILDLIIRYD